MNTDQFIRAVAQEAHLTHADVKRVLDAAWKTIETQCMTNGETVKVYGFGTFLAKSYKARKGFKPVSKEPIDIPPTTRLGYKPSKSLVRIDA